MRILSWNINSVRLRYPLALQAADWLRADVICLQETKCPDDLFPLAPFADQGYVHAHINGMKGYNGVAILSRLPFSTPRINHRVGREDCRHISVDFQSGTLGRPVTLHNIYIPAGGDIPDRDENVKFAHKLDFVDELTREFPNLHRKTDAVIAVGDFNIAPLEHDVWSHRQMQNVISHTAIEIEKFTKFYKTLPWVDAIRMFVPPDQKCYTWWSYRNQDWKKSDRGRRLDHIWVTKPIVDRLAGHVILREARDWPQTSDHVPVLVDIDL